MHVVVVVAATATTIVGGGAANCANKSAVGSAHTDGRFRRHHHYAGVGGLLLHLQLHPLIPGRLRFRL